MAKSFISILLNLPLLTGASFQDAFDQAAETTIQPHAILQENPNRDAAPRNLQNTMVDRVCQPLLANPPARGCTCQAVDDDDDGDMISLTCNDFCKQCLLEDDDADYCVTFSLVAHYTARSSATAGSDDYYPSMFQFREAQSGADSSNRVLVREQFYDEQFVTTGCSTFVDEQKCDSCTMNADCGGAIHDCRNVPGMEAVVDACDSDLVQSLTWDHPFSSLHPAVSNVENCVLQDPPKKDPPEEESKNDAKLFGGDENRGGLARKLRPRGG